MTDKILTDSSDGIFTVRFNRPEKKNAIDNAMWVALREAYETAAADDSVACLFLTAEGDNFCAGVDLASFGDAEAGQEHPFDRCARTIAAFDKPVVAAARGVSVGGGATILFHADLVYVGESLRMRLPFANLGLVPEFASSYVLQARIGTQRAAELFYTAQWIDAAKAVECGIALASTADDALEATAMERAREIAQWPVNALRETKRCLQVSQRAPIEAAFAAENAGMEKQAGSPENIEAITAFIEKRPPDFKKLRGG